MTKSDFTVGQEVELKERGIGKTTGTVVLVGYRYIHVSVSEAHRVVHFDTLNGFQQVPENHYRRYELLEPDPDVRSKRIESIEDILYWDSLDYERMSDEDLEDLLDLVKKYRREAEK